MVFCSLKALGVRSCFAAQEQKYRQFRGTKYWKKNWLVKCPSIIYPDVQNPFKQQPSNIEEKRVNFIEFIVLVV